MMGWSVAEQEWRKGPWTPEEDKLLTEYLKLHGEGRWSSVARSAGLKRSGKSCRLRWVNYLRPGLRRGHLTPQEEGIIIELHALWGNKWSTIARYLPGRTDNEIKNYWRTHFKKKPKPSERKAKRTAALNKQAQNQEKGAGSAKATTISPAELLSDFVMTSDQQPMFPTSGHPNMVENINSTPGLPVQYCYAAAEAWPSEESYTATLSGMQDGLWGWLWNFDDDEDLIHYNNYDRSCNKMINEVDMHQNGVYKYN